MHQVKVNRELCVGSGECVAIAPDAFTLDEEGLAQPLEGVSTTDREVLLRAAADCPTNSIQVETADGEVLYESD